MAHQMDTDVQQELRAIAGNNRCVDCQARFPQWATVSYGTFMCLECSGRHRGLGVHLSFVRSVTMDSWTDKQIKQMQLGGNEHFRSAFATAGVPASLSIAEKYNTPQAAAFREKLSHLAEGKPVNDQSLPAWTSSMQPVSASSDSRQGVEALAGETDEQYVARQHQLRDEARARMKSKFGSGGIGSGIGSSASSSVYSTGRSAEPPTAASDSLSLTGAFSMLSTTVSSVSSKLAETDVKSNASSGWAALSSGASSWWKTAQSTLYDEASEEPDNLFFPRTNPALQDKSSMEGISGASSRDEPAALPPAAPVATTSVQPTPSPVIPAAASPPVVVQKAKAPKSPPIQQDFFGDFGM